MNINNKTISLVKIKAFRILKFNRIFSYVIRIDDKFSFPAALNANNEIIMNPNLLMNISKTESPDEALRSNETSLIFLHEVLHDVLDHIPRRNLFLGSNASTNDCITWNIAADVVVNENLRVWSGMYLPEEFVLKESLNIPEDVPLIVEVIYRYLKDNTELQIKSQNCEGDYTIIDYSLKDKNTGNEYFNKKVIIFEKEKEKTKITYKIGSFKESLKKAGLDTDGIDGEVDFVKCPVNLKQYLYKYFETLRSGADDITFLRPSKLDYIMNGSSMTLKYPSFVSYKVRTVIGIDSSGSISDKEYSEFISTIYGNRDILEGKIAICDVEIQNTIDLTKNHENIVSLLKKRKGYGGTEYTPVFELAEKENVELVIYFTDLFPFGFPPKPRFKVLWVAKLTSSNYNMEVPYGKIIWY